MRIWLLLALTLTSSAIAQTTGLRALAAEARKRAETQRQVQLQAIKPYRAVLAADYDGDQKTILDEAFDRVAKIDGIAPLLLEYLKPGDSSREALNTSDNVARVLSRMKLDDYYQSLAELARSQSKTAKRNALLLLGYTGNKDAEAVLIPALDDPSDVERRNAVESLARIGSKAGILPASRLLGSPSRYLRIEVMQYLSELDTEGAAVARVVDAFAEESSDSARSYYIDYFRTHVRGDAEIAAKLLPLTQGNDLRYNDRRRLVRALGTIAPKGHEDTITALEKLVVDGGLQGVEIAAALSMRELGDKGGAKVIENRLDQAVRKRRQSAEVYEDRGDWHRDLEEWRDAIRDYNDAIKHARAGSRQSMLYLKVARCEAHRGKTLNIRKALQKSKASLRTIRREAEKDPVFAAQLEKDALQRFLNTL